MTRPAGRVPATIRAHIERDPWARSLGIEFLRMGRGAAQAALSLAPHMVNFQGTPHGGVIFSLADAAFSAACNSHGEAAVALSVTISYLASAVPGARLLARAQEVRQGRRAGFYDVRVTASDGRLVAVAHAVAHRLGGPLVPGRDGRFGVHTDTGSTRPAPTPARRRSAGRGPTAGRNRSPAGRAR